MPINKKLKWQRALSKLKFVHEELEYCAAVSKEAAPEFEAFYRKFCAANNIDIPTLDKEHKQRLDDLYGRDEITNNNREDESEIDCADEAAMTLHSGTPSNKLANDEYELSAAEIATHEAFSKLFKQIALKIHPDRIDKNLPESEIELRISMFQSCLNALEAKKYFILLDVATELKLSTPKNYEIQILWMKEEIKKLEASIEKEKTTYNYAYADSESEQDKEQLIKRFLHQLFGIIVE